MRSGWPIDLGAVLLALLLAVPVPQVVTPRSTVLLDRRGELLGAVLAADEQWRFPSGVVPDRYRTAVLRFEDRRFAVHPGVDPIALLRAFVANVRAGRVVSGGSTITMQVVRVSRGNPRRTLPEKLVEMVLAVRLELACTKAEILGRYAADAPYGGNTVGLEAASWRLFGRPPDRLSWAEVATLAVLPNSPGLVHAGRNRDLLLSKRDRLLDLLVADGDLTATDGALAKLEPLPEAPAPVPSVAPHLLAHAPHAATTTSTLDAALQRRATVILLEHGARFAPDGIHNAATLLVDVRSGEVLAYVGNLPVAGAPHENHVDVVRAPRSTGSTLKPFLYEAMLEDGELLPHELVPDVPMRIGGFAPENFDRLFDGALPASEALARSRNVPAAWMLRAHGVDRFKADLERLGMTTLDRSAAEYGLSLILGGAEGTLWDLVGMMRVLALAASGDAAPFVAVHWADAPPTVAPPAVDAGAAWLTLDALQGVRRPGVLAGWEQYGSGRPIAWKTGTSFGFRDAWAIGVTPDVAIGVWVGNADGEGRPGLTGVGTAAPILFDLLDLVPTSGTFPRPEHGLVPVEVCSHSGMRAGPDCPAKRWEEIPRAGLQGRGCSYCRVVHTDGVLRAHAGCFPVDRLLREPWFVLPPAMEVFTRGRDAGYRPLPPWRAGCTPDEEGTSALAIVSPKASAEVIVPRGLTGARGRLVLEATHRDPDAVVFWHLDETFVGTTHAPHQVELAPAPGVHHLVVVDAAGEREERAFTVRAGR